MSCEKSVYTIQIITNHFPIRLDFFLDDYSDHEDNFHILTASVLPNTLLINKTNTQPY